MTSTFVTVRSSGQARGVLPLRSPGEQRADGCPAACARWARRCHRCGRSPLVALVLMLLIGIHDARRPVYGPIDEITHTAYVLAVAKDGIPPVVGRDRAFVRTPDRSLRATCASPAPDKIGSAPLPIGRFGEVKQAEAIQPPSVLLRRRAGDVVRVRARQGGRAAAVRRLPLPLRGRDHLLRRPRHRRDTRSAGASRRSCLPAQAA